MLSDIKFDAGLQKESESRNEELDMSFLDLLYSDGISKLNNGLDPEDNKILFRSTNIIEIVALVLKGLKARSE